MAVEFIDYDISEAPKPKTFKQCYDRAQTVIQLFVDLDEKIHHYHGDIKPGQWMVRKDGSMLFQDLDDIYPAKTNYATEFTDKRTLQTMLAEYHDLSFMEIDKILQTKIFPRGELTIRLNVMNSGLIWDNIGFDWSTDRS